MQIVKWGIFLILGFYLCGILTVFPLASEYQWYRPLWLLMFVVFCQIQQPTLFNPLLAWIIGLLADSLVGTQLGEQALIFSIISYITSLLRSHFMARPLWIQCGKIFLVVSLGQIFILWFHALAGQNPHTLFYWMGSVISAVVWPLFVLLLQSVGHLLNIAPYKLRAI